MTDERPAPAEVNAEVNHGVPSPPAEPHSLIDLTGLSLETLQELGDSALARSLERVLNDTEHHRGMVAGFESHL
jgi:FXSXX-COOH protein